MKKGNYLKLMNKIKNNNIKTKTLVQRTLNTLTLRKCITSLTLSNTDWSNLNI